MGHNADLAWLMNLPTKIECPHCKKKLRTHFEDYDIDCGTPMAVKGRMELDLYCLMCDRSFAYVVAVEPKGVGK